MNRKNKFEFKNSHFQILRRASQLDQWRTSWTSYPEVQCSNLAVSKSRPPVMYYFSAAQCFTMNQKMNLSSKSPICKSFLAGSVVSVLALLFRGPVFESGSSWITTTSYYFWEAQCTSLWTKISILVQKVQFGRASQIFRNSHLKWNDWTSVANQNT